MRRLVLAVKSVSKSGHQSVEFMALQNRCFAIKPQSHQNQFLNKKARKVRRMIYKMIAKTIKFRLATAAAIFLY